MVEGIRFCAKMALHGPNISFLMPKDKNKTHLCFSKPFLTVRYKGHPLMTGPFKAIHGSLLMIPYR